jgi:hypothetical protein
LDGIREFGSRLSNFAQNNPEVNICLALPENGIHSSVVPPWSYVSRTWSLEETLAVWREQLDGVDTVFDATSPVASFEEYLERYYRCDDHWNGFGALLTYNEMARQMGLPEFPEDIQAAPYLDEYSFYGQNGRKGRMLIDQMGTLREPDLDVSGLRVSDKLVNTGIMMGGQVPIPEDVYAKFNFYGWFFGGDAASVIVNDSSPNDEVVLVICDSFGDAFRWMVALNCRETHAVYDLYGSDESDASLRDRIEEVGATKVVFVGSASDYSAFC